MVPFCVGLTWMGAFQLKRNFSPARGSGLMSRVSSVWRLMRARLPP
jgi:hypothetical protein